MGKIFILYFYTESPSGWEEIEESELQNLVNDGSIKDGTLIVHPKEVLVAKKTKPVVTLWKRKEKQNGTKQR